MAAAHDAHRSCGRFPKKLLTAVAGAWFSAFMTQRNTRANALLLTSRDMLAARLAFALAALVLVLVLITGPTGTGVGFA